MIGALVVVAAVSIVLSSLTVCLPGCAYALGRFRARRRRRSYTNAVVARPPVPAPRPVAEDVRLLRVLPPVPPSRPAPYVFPADVTLAELEQAALAHDFTEIIRREFPQYRSFRDAA